MSKLVFLDEASSNIAMTRRYARAPRGERAHGRKPFRHGANITMLAALFPTGLKAMMTIEGGVSAEVFLTWVQRVLVPQLKPGNIVLMDNLGSHKVEGVEKAIRSAGASLVYLPPYSPDLNPIELAWAVLKGFLRSAEARTRRDLDDAIAAAMNVITRKHAVSWIRHCGYGNQPTRSAR